MSYFEATSSFDAALAEVEHLLELAEHTQSNRLYYLTYLKAALVLLGAKFEAFAESIVENYIDRLTEFTPRTRHLPRELRTHSTTILLNQCVSEQRFSAKPVAISSLVAAAALWNDEDQHHTLTVSNKFNYGKHGSGELRALFQRIGIGDILNDCQVSTSTETMLGIITSRESISSDIDSFTHIRNNVIHSDSNPGNITHQQIRGYKERFWEFGYAVDQRLDNELLLIEAGITANP